MSRASCTVADARWLIAPAMTTVVKAADTTTRRDGELTHGDSSQQARPRERASGGKLMHSVRRRRFPRDRSSKTLQFAPMVRYRTILWLSVMTLAGASLGSQSATTVPVASQFDGLHFRSIGPAAMSGR